MGQCDEKETAFEDALAARDDVRDELSDELREQFDNYKEYWNELRSAAAEFFILRLFGEKALGGALGGYSALFGVNSLEDRINELHNDIETSKEDLSAFEQAANDAAKDLCDCYAEHGFE